MNFMNNESYMDSDELEEMTDKSGIGIREMLEHMRQQLVFLEKKVDMLLSRTEGERHFNSPRPAPPRSFRKPYDKPSQRFELPPRRERNENDDRERGFRDRESSRVNYSDRRKAGKKPAGKPRSNFGKKPFYSRYSD